MDSGFGCLLREHGRALDRKAPPQLHHPRVGRRHLAFLTERDARLYDAGYLAFPHGPDGDGPFRQGWLDAEHDCDEIDEARRDARAGADDY